MAHNLIKPLHLQGGGFETFPNISEPLKKTLGLSIKL